MFLEKAKNKMFWENVRTNAKYQPMIAKVLQEYEKVAREELKEISYDVFMLYHKTGERKVFEREYYMPRRQRLSVCALLSLIYPDKEEYFSNLMNTIWAICNEYCWCLPCHNDTSAEAYDNSFIDLFAAETGQALSEIRFLLGDRMGKLMNERIQREIDIRIIQSFMNRSFWWENARLNWSAVCGGCIGCTFMYERPDLFWQVKPRIDYSMERFLSGYKEDGVSCEGVLYWHYGFGFFTCYAQHLLEFSEGKYNYFADEHVKTIAHFLEMTLMGNGSVVSFSDCKRTVRVGLGTMGILDYHYGDILCSIPREYYMIIDSLNRSRWQMVVRGFVYFDPEKNYNGAIKNGIYFKKDSEWFVKKCSSYYFAAKGGHNGEPHNHNDIGSFLISLNGKQILADLGSGEYKRAYFNDEERYSILCNRSGGHSVPILDGQEQCEGKAYAGEMEYGGNKLTIDITNAYPKTRISKLVREFTFAENSIQLKDSFSITEPCEIKDRMVSLVKPAIVEGYVKLDPFAIEFDCKLWEAKVTEEIHTRYDSTDETVYLIDFERKHAETTEFVAQIVRNE